MIRRMPISNDRIDEFIQRYERAFGDRISREEARTMAAKLVNLYRLILQPLPDETMPPSEVAEDQTA